jgi:hypothetical protein
MTAPNPIAITQAALLPLQSGRTGMAQRLLGFGFKRAGRQPPRRATAGS